MQSEIIFLMPSRGLRKSGGFTVIFKYADFFVTLGYKITIIYPYVDYNFFDNKASLLMKIKTGIGFIFKYATKRIEKQQWYTFEKNVNQKIVFRLNKSISESFSKNAIIFASAVDTAHALAKMKTIQTQKKYYLIQGFENWNCSDAYVYDSYKFPFQKIVIAKWLKREVEKTGEKAVLIQNGLDFDYFRLNNAIENRNSYEVAMLYHTSEIKRCTDAIEALAIVKKKIPKLHVTMFGVYDCPQLPPWFSYYKFPDKDTHNRIYNTAAIFVAPSSTEGWGLTPCEAMQCGCAVACTNAGGFLEFAKDKETALVSPIYDINALANNILKLVTDDTLRIKVAKAGNEYIKQFTWEKAFSKMKNLIL